MKWTSSSDPYTTAPEAGAADAWTRETGGRGSQRLLGVETVPAPGAVASALALEPGSLVVRRARLVLLDDVPIEHVVSYWPANWAAGTALAEPRAIKGGSIRLLADLGYTTSVKVDDVDAVKADDDVPWAPAGEPVLLMVRTLYGQDGEPFEYCVMHRWNGEPQRYVEKAV